MLLMCVWKPASRLALFTSLVFISLNGAAAECRNGILRVPDVDDTEPPLNDELKELIVRTHNFHRSCVASKNEYDYCLEYGPSNQQPGAEYMLEMEWDERLADLAQKWANKCEFRHDRQENLHNVHPEFTDIGSCFLTHSSDREKMNINAEPSVEEYMKMWFNEHKHYTYSPILEIESGNTTAHYTQMVAANTFKIGCGYSYSYIRNTRLPFVDFFTCYYGPIGNIIGFHPYIKGSPSCRKRLTAGSYPGLCKYKSRRKPETFVPY